VTAKMRFIVIMVAPECWGVAEGRQTYDQESFVRATSPSVKVT